VPGSSIDLIGNATKYCGKTSDGKHWFLCYNLGLTNSRLMAWGVVDTTNDTYQYSTLIPSMHTGTANTVGTFIPSAFSVCANDSTRYKMYCPSDANSVAGDLSIKVLQQAIAGGAVTAGFTPNSPTTCTITGMPVLGMPYTMATPGCYASVAECWTFADSGSEFLAVAYHSAIDVSSNNYSGNLCPVAKHAIHVFLIDPTDPTKLTYKSSLTNNAFGSNATLPILLKSTDGKTLVAGSSQGFTTITWNAGTTSFVNGQWNQMQLLNLHLDNANQIWVRDYSENLYLFSPTQSLNIVVNFDVPQATYAGSPLTVNALVSAYDFTGARTASSVQLAISGGTFAGGATSVTVTTLTSGDAQVPVTINGAGSVVVTPII
jgi:hypothetical protein